ncbi:MAG: S-adenosylmethionine:tRNA ribosyltransferase-isomerase, partial [Proteobacteria bacterium]|nr:S-adenosylmethionine:tRNA ribosyltransferase-isomerase [Pseudomonadota bacterium]
PLKKLSPGTVLVFPQGLTATVLQRSGEMELTVDFTSADTRSVRDLLFEVGSMPVPPYIRGGRGDEADRSDYQSIFAAVEGSVAAPTASLHFTPELVASMRAAGAVISEITLHVGAASFLPLWREGQSVKITPPGSERGIYSATLREKILATKGRGNRVITVGTTVVRAVETMMRLEHRAEGEPFDTDLFISPGFKFKAVDWLVTNFHQPATTHLLLVEALLGRNMLAKGYQHALANGYRFLSYGDGMVIIP